MAEERLIDDDKDKKYKIRINENGEEELVISDEPDEEEIPVLGEFAYEDDEEAVDLTPEQLAERERLKEQEEKARQEKFNAFIEKAKAQLEEGDFVAAAYSLIQAEELDDKNGELYCLKLKAHSRNFTDFLSSEKCEDAAEGVKSYAVKEDRAKLLSEAEGLKTRISEVEEKTQRLKAENEEGKAERRDTFAREKRQALIIFLCVAVPLLACAVLTIVFATMMFADENGAYLIATIVLGAVTLISLTVTLISGHRLWNAARKVKLNERDNTTKVGREYLESKKEFERLKNIYSCLSDDI